MLVESNNSCGSYNNNSGEPNVTAEKHTKHNTKSNSHSHQTAQSRDESVPISHHIDGDERAFDSVHPASANAQHASQSSPHRPAESQPQTRVNNTSSDDYHASSSSHNGSTQEDSSISNDDEQNLTPRPYSRSRESDEWAAIQRIVSTMFGRARQEESEEEKTRHLGVVWRNITVKGVGAGATLQSTVADIFLGIPRFLGRLVTGKVGRKPPVRTILDDFTVGRDYSQEIFLVKKIFRLIMFMQGCVRPGEMLLVLGQPGAGCSTFLKIIGNQRAGYESIEGSVSYGGTDAKRMAKNYRSEG